MVKVTTSQKKRSHFRRGERKSSICFLPKYIAMESNENDFNDRFFSEFEYLYQRVHEAEGPLVCQHEDDYNFQADEVYLALKRPEKAGC